MSFYNALISECYSNMLSEELKPLPGNNRGFVAHDKIDDNDVHVHFIHFGNGHYLTTARVNGAFHEDSVKDPETKKKVIAFVKSARNEFVSQHKPLSLRAIGNSRRKSKLYKKEGQRYAKKTGGKANRIGKGSKIVWGQNKTEHKPSGHIGAADYNKADPAYKYASSSDSYYSSRSKLSAKDDKYYKKMKKNKANSKGEKVGAKAEKGAYKGSKATGSW